MGSTASRDAINRVGRIARKVSGPYFRAVHKCLAFLTTVVLVSLSSIQLLRCQHQVVPVVPGDVRMEAYLPLLANRHVGVVCNHTAVIEGASGGVHLVDSLLARGVKVGAAFAPEHGFRGRAAAGAHIENGVDPVSGIAIHSLYGRTKKPTPEMLAGLDILVFDIQDVGARFYTYLSTLHYVMEAAAENGLPLILLDRPNPNSKLCDGPILDTNFRSFVGMHPIPLAHGMTLGELATMINGEGWIASPCDLTVIDCTGWNRSMDWPVPIAPSPNLPDANSISLYPSLCLFEATRASIGRGTEHPFGCVGYPGFPNGSFQFTPESCEAAPSPKYEGQLCNGQRLLADSPTEAASPAMPAMPAELQLGHLIDYRLAWLLESDSMLESNSRTPAVDGAPSVDRPAFIDRPDFFDKLAGTDELRRSIQAGHPIETIRANWAPGIAAFKERRAPYLRYPE